MSKLTKKIVVALGFHLILLGLVGQPTTFRKPIFQHISQDSLGVRINDLLQDHKGYMWLGTESGLFRFDGFKFQTFITTDHNPKFSKCRINQVFEDDKGQLWVATDSMGLARFDGSTQNFELITATSASLSLSSNSVTKISEDQEGNLWVATTRGVHLMDPARTKIDHLDEMLQTSFEQPIIEMMEDNDGRMWLASTDGLFIYYPNEKKLIKPDLGIGSTNLRIRDISKLLQDSKGGFWIGTGSSGVFTLSEEDVNSFSSRRISELDQSKITDIAEDKDGNIWISTDSGLHVLDSNNVLNSHFHDESNETSLSSDDLTSICFDNKDRLWASSSQGDLNVLDPNRIRFNHLKRTKNSELSSNQINAFSYNSEQEIWLGTDGGGITVWDRSNNTFTSFKDGPDDPTNIGTNAILDFIRTQNEDLWFTSWGGGFRKFDPIKKRFTPYEDQNYKKFPFNETHKWNVFDIEEDTQANLWVAHYYGGILRVPHEEAERLYILAYSKDSDDVIHLSDPNVFCLELENDSLIWVGTKNGLNKVELQGSSSFHVTHYFDDESDTTSLSSSEINTIFVDSQKRTWIGTPDGLHLYHPASDNFLRFSIEDGLPDPRIMGVIQDSFGDFWITTARGLCKMSETAFGEFRFRSYLQNDGLPDDEFRREAIYLSSKGEIFLGSSDGIIYFFPNEVAGNPYKLKAHFTDIKILGNSIGLETETSDSVESINNLKEIKLNYDQSQITIEFVALTLVEPEKNEYAYLLSGFEEEWNYLGGQQSVTFTDLDPGEYLFRLKAANNDGVWNHEEEKTLKIVVLPPWWASWWFRVFIILIVGLTIYFLYRKYRPDQLVRKSMMEPISFEGRTPRLHALDSMQGVMMLLGLVLHGALFYFPSIADFPVDPNSQNPDFFHLTSLIHKFRMPSFFLVSGFFGALLFYEKGPKMMIKNRWARIALPFIIFLPFIHFAQSVGFAVAWLGSNTQGFELNLSKLIIRFLPTQTMHLWFLYYLFFFSVILFGLSYLSRDSEPINRQINALYGLLFRNKIIGLIILSLMYGGVMQSMDVFHAHQSDISSFNPLTPSFVLFFFFYVNGWLLYSIRERLNEFKFGTILLLLLVFVGMDTGVKEFINRIQEDKPNVKKTITFQVDLENIPLDTIPDFEGIFFHSSFLGWCEFCGNKMEDEDNDKVYRITYDVPVGFHNYIYSINGYMYYDTPLDGHLSEDAICKKEYRLSSIWNDYGIYVEPDQASSTVLPPVCYTSCQTCDGDETLVVEEPYEMSLSMAYNRFSNGTYSVLLTYLALAFFLMFFKKESKVMRYVNDASYWVYLQHLWLLPIFAGLLMAYEFSAVLKLVIIVVATLIVTFISYHTLVRYTFIGKLLNGRKHSR